MPPEMKAVLNACNHGTDEKQTADPLEKLNKQVTKTTHQMANLGILLELISPQLQAAHPAPKLSVSDFRQASPIRLHWGHRAANWPKRFFGHSCREGVEQAGLLELPCGPLNHKVLLEHGMVP